MYAMNCGKEEEKEVKNRPNTKGIIDMDRRHAGQNLIHGNKIVLLGPPKEEKKDYTPQIIIAIATIISALIIVKRD